MNIFTTIGAYSQFIKAAVVSGKMSERKCVQEVIMHTGPHFDAQGIRRPKKGMRSS
jgi:UDP-N-acetylglucosamine 2-epimerase